jgi:hypothetical protein
MPTLPFECPRELFCSTVTENSPPCGSPETLPADLRAELLCPQALTNAIRHEQEAGSADPNQTAHHYRLGSLFLDLSLAPGVQSSDRFSNTAFDHLSTAAAGETEEAADAALLVAYREAFDVRRGADVAPYPMHRVGSNLHALATSHHMAVPNMQARLGTHLLYRRLRMSFPLTARESDRLGRSTRDAAEIPYCYTLLKDGKLPVIQGDGTPKFYTRHGMVVWDFNSKALYSLNRNASTKYPAPPNDPEAAGKMVLNWLCTGFSRDDYARKTTTFMVYQLRDQGYLATAAQYRR